ncbi:MAG: pyruvate kinase [Desulfurivibrionaceae bacterium]|nr:pyruvate kinase [Desulfurivibrionaceae bacterium]
MDLVKRFTKIVCTIGPASDSPQMIERLIEAGMDVARINFSHGDFQTHGRVIKDIRRVSAAMGIEVAILADLPGPKMRIGELATEPIELEADDTLILTTREIVGSAARVSVSFAELPTIVAVGDLLFINDGLIQLQVLQVEGSEVHCRIIVGGELRSRKGLNLPGIDLGISAFTEHDQACLQFALAHGVDAIGQSFVNNGADIEAVRRAAAALGHQPFVIAKIERAGALENMDEILGAADGIMIARGDLGVEIPIERIAMAQKKIMEKALLLGKPIITATQMLESMTQQKRPTRAEATDVANAILDGTDCVMLSGESAMGRYPVAAVEMLARIAAETEPFHADRRRIQFLACTDLDKKISPRDLIAQSVNFAVERSAATAIFVPTMSGTAARNITRFRLPVAIVAVSPSLATVRALRFSYGVHSEYEPAFPDEWNHYARKWLADHNMPISLVLLVQGPSPRHPAANNSMQLVELGRP